MASTDKLSGEARLRATLATIAPGTATTLGTTFDKLLSVEL